MTHDSETFSVIDDKHFFPLRVPNKCALLDFFIYILGAQLVFKAHSLQSHNLLRCSSYMQTTFK